MRSRVLVLGTLGLLSLCACGGAEDPDGDPAATGAGANGAAGSDPSTSGACVNEGAENLDCPLTVAPLTGSCAPKGACCHRASNNARMALLGPDQPAVLEYRLNMVEVINHPLTISQPVLKVSAAARAEICSGEQCVLWRFTLPRAGGELVEGPSTIQIGIGAYNCDGTYSFYGPSAAPPRDGISNDPGRWQAPIVDAEFDPKKQGMEQHHIPRQTNGNREIARSVFLAPTDNSIDWELANSGFEITSLDSSEAGRDCIGSRDAVQWVTGGTFVSYSPMAGNDVDVNDLIYQPYCQLLAFGILEEGKKDTSCADTPRCLPTPERMLGDPDRCPWVKLPDSLCPVDDLERALFGCHLGAEGNINGEDGYPATLRCTADKPTSPLDPDSGATVDGQCCDPLGQSAALPACNAHRTLQKYVAAAAEITDEPRDSVPPVCR